MRNSRERADLLVPKPASGSLVPLVPGSSLECSDLAAAYDGYRAVAGGAAPDLIRSPDMLRARVALTRTLLAAGWNAPAVVLDRLRQDEALLLPHVRLAS